MKLTTAIAPAVSAALALFSADAIAQEPLWEVVMVGGEAVTPAYPGSEDRSRRGLLLPFLIYRGEVLRADQSGIGARLAKNERIEFDVGLAASLPADSDDVAARAGLPDLGTLVEAGPRLKVRLAGFGPGSRLRLDLPLRAVIEARSGLRGQGITFEPKLVAEARGPRGSWTADANVGVVLGDRKINGYFYDVAPQYATDARPAYDAGAGLMLVRAGVSGSREVHPDVRLFGFLRHDSYARSASRDSPLMKRNSGTSAGFGFVWTIKRSAEPAR